ncbi:Hypothetical_protein [Hexamita inflata]|uniref:Hypothetical_protein n=1 Tax=Hexamita inflata TaxID=28002 RepID=A0AA86Q0A4_9EUKA|nr:Hypothetical protein HINF_LOCUS35082 [Hexamita inflata]
MQNSLNAIFMQKSYLQFRFNSQKCSGLVYNIIDNIFSFNLDNISIVGYNFYANNDNGNIVSTLQIPSVLVQINSVKVCSSLINQVGVQYLSVVSLSQQLISECQHAHAHKLERLG